MEQTSIIHDLLIWIEGQLDQPLSLDDVADKAGYSKWHLQRKFKIVTGTTLGAYIRARRLTLAAVALRATGWSILDIVCKYHFDTQQTFTRAFKKQFAQTPLFYRKSSNWPFSGICPPMRLGHVSLPQPVFLKLPETPLVGVTWSYSCSLASLCSFFRTDLSIHFWFQYMETIKVIPPVLYGLNDIRPSGKKYDERDVTFYYTTALDPRQVPEHAPKGKSLVLKGGEYVQFTFTGAGDGLQDFILRLYDTYLPMLKLTRREGLDIERLYTTQRGDNNQPPYLLCCQYLIPIYR